MEDGRRRPRSCPVPLTLLCSLHRLLGGVPIDQHDRTIDRQVDQRTVARGAAFLLSPATIKLRRRPLLAILGVLLTVSAAAVAGWAVLNAQNTERVLGVAKAIPAGQKVDVEDLTYVEIPVGSMPAAVRGSDAEQVLGRYAIVTLLPGQILVDEALAESLVPPAGFSLVAVAVDAGRLPTVPLEAGDRIDIVSTPSEQEAPPHDRAPDSLTATVVSSEPLADTSKTVVNVQIVQSRAGLLAARAATGRVAIVIRTRGR